MVRRHGSPHTRLRLPSIPFALGVLLVASCTQQKTEKAAPSPEKAPSTAPVDDKPAPEPAPTPVANGDARTWTFDDTEPGSIPKGFAPAETGSQGNPATWEVVANPSAPTPPNAFGITKSLNDKRTYNLAIVGEVEQADVDLSVMVRANGGELNQGGGPIWRVKDADNYYIARWDPSENNAYLYVMQAGHRSALAKVDIELDPEAWHTLRVVMEGSHMELFIDETPVLEADDTAHSNAGGIGLWTKSDSTTLFDDLSLTKP